MTDALFLPIWLLLSWLIRRVESEIDPAEEPAGEAAATGAEAYEPMEQIIKIGITAFSVLLLGLSISAYRKTALKGIVYAAVAFGLFAVQMLFDYMGDAIKAFDTPFNDIVFSGITLIILALFFMAIVKRNRIKA
jgi:hypothetical protein